MSRILFVVSSERGHINPCIGPARLLQEKGHTVAFFSMYNISEQLKKAGFGQSFSARSEAAPPATVNRGSYFAEHIRKDAEWVKFSLKTAYIDRVAKQVEALKKVVRDFNPEAIAVDPKTYEGAIVAEMKKLPWATLSPSLTMVSPDSLKSELAETCKWFEKDRNELFDGFGVKVNFRYSDCLSPHLNMCFATDKLVTNATHDVKLIGPSMPVGDRGDECDFPWKKIDDNVPQVYVWLGSQTFYQPEIMHTLMNAVKGKEVQLICAASELADVLLIERVQKNVIILNQTPQLALLPAMEAHITHGGASSVMESIAMGVPMIVSPMYNDQAHQAYYVDKAGIGKRLDLATMDADACWTSIQTVIHGPKIKEAMEKVQLSYKQHDGSVQAARLLERLIK